MCIPVCPKSKLWVYIPVCPRFKKCVYLSVPRPIGPVKSTAGVQVNWGNPPHLKRVLKVYWTIKRPLKPQLVIDFELYAFSPFIYDV